MTLGEASAATASFRAELCEAVPVVKYIVYDLHPPDRDA
jgi:hypothetical protein